EDYLPTRIDPERTQFFRKLLEVEIELRCANGEKPTLEEYEPRFPEHLASVKVVLGRTDSVRPPAAASGTLPGGSRYDIIAEVARGGMGIVYRGRHKILDKKVAIKVLLPGRSTERFLREARLLAQINSPYVVTIHDFEILPDGRPMLCMEWVEGTNLLEV